MAGTLTIGGQSGPLASGAKQLGPITIQGKAAVGQITDLKIAAGDNTVAVPEEATAVLIAFPFSGEPQELKLRSNLDALDGGIPISSNGFAAFPLPAGVTQLILHATGSVGTVEFSFI